MDYSDKVVDHYTHPRNVGKIEDASGIGEVGNPVCGDIMKMFIKVENNIITDVKFKTFGCGAVTHVLVNDPTTGYAVFGDLMIKQTRQIN